MGELAEHGFLGDGVRLQVGDDQTNRLISKKVPINLPNGLQLTYGKINWLAGDFFATETPISDGSDPDGAMENFKKAFAMLGIREEAKQEAEDLIKHGQAEIDAVEKAVAAGQDPSNTAYKDPSLSGTGTFEWDLRWRKWGEGYIGLATINFDHFGLDARKAYKAGHRVALEAASKGDLNMGYAYNAFADHFLEDSFSAGHMRTPRRFLHSGGKAGDKCAQYMHDEDSAIGLNVTNPAGDPWKAYGDKRILDTEDGENQARCKLAIQTSVNEVIEAYNSRRIPDIIDGAWAHAPTLESANDMSKQELSPLFTFDGKVRTKISDRRDFSHSGKSWWNPLEAWCAENIASIEWSGLWNDGNLHM